jgi:hypothetical protein
VADQNLLAISNSHNSNFMETVDSDARGLLSLLVSYNTLYVVIVFEV